MVRRLRVLALVAIALAPLPTLAATQATPAEAPGAGSAMHDEMKMAPIGPLPASMQGKPLVVQMSPDAAATMSRLKQEYGSKVNYVEFNMSNATMMAAAREKAKKMGLLKLFDATHGSGPSAIVDPRTGSVAMIPRSGSSYSEYKKEIDRQLLTGIK